MQLLKQEFESFEEANYWVDGLSIAIDTTYLPSGDSVTEVYASFLEIQLGRSFNNCGFGSASLVMVFNERTMTIRYISTSGTEVYLQYWFNEDMKFKGGSVECWLPDERVGGHHYETLTEFIYKEWSKEEEGEVKVPLKLMSLNPALSEADFPTPVWVLDVSSNTRAENNPAERDARLLELGYIPVSSPLGFKRVWEKSEAYYKYIILQEKEYIVLKKNSLVCDNYPVSYRRLLEILAEPPKERGRARRAQAAGEDCTEVEE